LSRKFFVDLKKENLLKFGLKIIDLGDLLTEFREASKLHDGKMARGQKGKGAVTL